MPTVNECIQERSVLSSLNLLENNLIAYSTKYNGIKIIDSNEFQTQIKISSKEIDLDTSKICFSPNAKLAAFANNNIIHVLNLRKKQIIQQIKISPQEIETLSFCANSTYIIVGTKTGRVYQYKYNSSALLSRLCSFSYTKKKQTESYVSAMTVFKNKLACSGAGGSVYLLDLYSQTEKRVLLHEGPRINTLCFVDESTLVSGDIHGTITVFSLASSNKVKIIDAPFINITQIVKMPNPNYILISSNTNYLAIADISKGKILHSKYVEFSVNVKYVIVANEDTILVALEDNKILTLHIDSPADLKSHIIHNSLYEAYKLVENEPMLHSSLEYKILEKRYQQIYNDALKALMNQNKNLALGIIDLLKGVRQKEQEIRKLFQAFENYDRFKILYLEKKHTLAYALCNKYPALQKTPLYLKLEEVFKENFINAQRHIQIGKIEHAKALMHDYITIASKREMIKLFLNQENEFIRFLKAIDEKDFQTIEELEQKNQLYSQIPTYKSLQQSTQKTIHKIELLINQAELNKAQTLLSQLKNSSYLKQELKKLHQLLLNMEDLQKAYAKNDFIQCYELLDTYSQLNSSELGILLNKHWAKLINECEEFALKGNVGGVKTKLDTLISISTRKHKIGDLLRVSFHSKIKAFLANKKFKNAENILYSYIDIFGIDNEINYLMQAYEVHSKKSLAITQNQNERTQRDQWLYSELMQETTS